MRRVLYVVALVCAVVECAEEEKDFTPGRQPNSRRRVSDGLTYEEERALKKAKRDAMPKTAEGRWELVKDSFTRLNDPLERAKMLEKQGMARQFGQTDEQYRRMKSVYGRMARDEVNRLEREKTQKAKQVAEDAEFRRKRAQFFNRGKKEVDSSSSDGKMIKAGGLLAGIPIIGALVGGNGDKDDHVVATDLSEEISIPTKVAIGGAAVVVAAGIVKSLIQAIMSDADEEEPKYTPPPPPYSYRRERPKTTEYFSSPPPPKVEEDKFDEVTTSSTATDLKKEANGGPEITAQVESSDIDPTPDIPVVEQDISHTSDQVDESVSSIPEEEREEEEEAAVDKEDDEEDTSAHVSPSSPPTLNSETNKTVDSIDLAHAHAAATAKRSELNPSGISHEAMERLQESRIRDELLGRIEARYKLLEKSIPMNTAKLSIAELRAHLESLRAEQGAHLAPPAPISSKRGVTIKPVPSGGGTGTPKAPLNFADVNNLGTNFKAAAAKKKNEARRARRGKGGIFGAVGRGLGSLVGRGRKNRLALVVIDPNKCAIYPYKESKPEVTLPHTPPVCTAKPRSMSPKKSITPKTDATPEIFTSSSTVETKTYSVTQKHSIAARPPDDLLVARETVCEVGSLSTNFRSAVSTSDRPIANGAAARISVSQAGATKTNFRAAANKVA